MVNPELAKVYDKNPRTPIPVKDYLQILMSCY